MRYVLYTFHTGHSRIEKITRSRPAEAIIQELHAVWGNRGRAKVVTEVTEHVGSADYISPETYRRSSRFL